MESPGSITLPRSEYDQLLTKAERQRIENERQRIENDRLRAQNDWLIRQVFGRKSERFAPAGEQQLCLVFDGTPLDAQAGETVAQAVAAYERKKTVAEKQPHPGRMPIPAHLRREEVVVEPDGDTTGMVRIGEDITETLEYTPAEIFVKRTIRPKYAKPAQAQQEGESPIVQAPAPDTPIRRSKAGASLIAHILIAKYLEHLPLHRLLARFARGGLKIPPQTIGNWVKNGINLLGLLYQVYEKWLLGTDYLQIDETHIKVLEDGKGKCHLGYYWVVFDPVRRLPYFHYHPGRDHGLPLKLLNDFRGTVQCDGYSVYGAIQKLRPGQIQLANCMAHIRREFFEARGNDAQRSKEALAIIRQMYAVEEEARELQLTAPARCELRKEKLQPLFTLFKAWLDSNLAATTPASTIGKAIRYALNRWPNMQAILQDGRIEIDNNLVENAIRPVAIGRKNYLFAGSHEAASRAAMIYTFFSACKHSNVNPDVWLPDVLNRIQDTKIVDLLELLPHNWKPIEN